MPTSTDSTNLHTRSYGVQCKIQPLGDQIYEPSNYQVLEAEQTPIKQNVPFISSKYDELSDGKMRKESFERYIKIPVKYLISGEICKSYGSRELYLKTILKEAFLYGIFITLLSVLIYDYSSLDIDLFVTSIVNRFIRCDINTDGIGGYTFEDINTIDQVWLYLYLLVDILSDNNFFEKTTNLSKSNHKRYSRDNDLIGLPRLRSVRVRSVPCLLSNDIPCYSFYSNEHDTRTFGLKNSTAWHYQSAVGTGMDRIHGKLGSYSGGGFCQDFNKSRDEFRKSLETLKKGKWIDRATRAITMDFTVYNVNLDVFAIVNLLFEIPPTGGVLPSYSVDSLKITDYSNKTMFYIVCTLGIFTLIIFYTLQGICELIYFQWRFFSSFFNCLSLCLTILCYYVIFRNIQKNEIFKIYIKETVSEDSKYANFCRIRNVENVCNLTESLLVFLSWMKAMKYISINHTIYKLQITIQKSLKEIIFCSIIILYVIFVLIVTANILFGNYLECFSTLSLSTLTIMQLRTGELDHSPFERVQPFLGRIFYLIDLFVIRIVFIAVYIAILLNAYTDMLRESKLLPELIRIGDILKSYSVDILGMLSHKQSNRLRKYFNRREIQKEFQDVRYLLRKYGFTQVEIDSFLLKYETPDTILTKEDLYKIREEFRKKDTSKIYLVRKIVMENVEEKLVALEEAVTDANLKTTLILQVFDLIEDKTAKQ